MSQYSFPVLEESDMIAFLSDIGFPFQPAWRKPTQAMVTEIYANLVDIVVGVEKERLTRPEYGVMEQHGIHQDVYTRGLPELGMLMIIFQLMDACCVFNFSLRDITAPSWPRLRTILSGVINFVRFQHEFFNAFDSAVEKTKAMEDEHQALLHTIEHLSKEYQQHVGSPEVQLLRQLQKQQEVLEQELASKKESRATLEEEFRAESAKLKLISEQVQAHDETIKGLKYELDLLKGKDVSGLLHDVENLKAKVEVQLKTSETQQQDLVVLRNKQDLVVKCNRALDLLITEFQDYTQSSSIYQETLNRVSVLQTQLAASHVKSNTATAHKDDLSQQANVLKTELASLNQRHEDQVKSKQEAIQALIKEKREMETTDRTNNTKIDEFELKTTQIRTEIESQVQKHHSTLDDAIKRIILLGEAVYKFHDRVAESCRDQDEPVLKPDEGQD